LRPPETRAGAARYDAHGEGGRVVRREGEGALDVPLRSINLAEIDLKLRDAREQLHVGRGLVQQRAEQLQRVGGLAAALVGEGDQRARAHRLGPARQEALEERGAF